MKLIILVLAVTLAMVATNNAAEKTKNDVPTATELIKVQKALDLFNAITYITGNHDKVIGEKADKVINVPFELGTTAEKAADIRWALADDIAALRKFVTNAQDIQKKLTEQAEAKADQHPLQPKRPAVLDARGNVVEPAILSEAQVELNNQIQALLDSERPIDKLFRVKGSELRVGVNQFPGPILTALEPVVDR